ncbi:hypothetical protein BKA80DRAFT_34820 [Phyllosticta citrichinensis]
MRDFAESLTELPALNDSAIRLQKLCAALVGLCTPLIQRAKAAAAAANQMPEPGVEGGPSGLGQAGEEGGVGSGGGGGGASYGASGSGAGQGARGGDPRASRPRRIGVGGGGGGSGQERPQPFYPNSVMGESMVAMMTPELSQPPWYQTSMYPETGGVGASGSRAAAAGKKGSAAVEGAAGAAGSAGAEGPQTGSSEEMFNALFDVQPSLDWLGADVFSNSQGSGNGNNGASGSTGSGAAGNAVVPGWIDWDVMGGGWGL